MVMQKKILAIDDSIIVLRQLQNILERYYEFKGVTSGLAGLKILESEKVDLVLLDLQMPVMDGFATLTAIRQRENLKELPVIILTVDSHKQRVVKGIMSGVAGYVVKPVDSDQLLDRIEKCLYAGEEGFLF
ncbi:MAG: response regulator [Lachnospiraceae bacterium]|nr:response regulator [Lachnospiraceae bacterium]